MSFNMFKNTYKVVQTTHSIFEIKLFKFWGYGLWVWCFEWRSFLTAWAVWPFFQQQVLLDSRLLSHLHHQIPMMILSIFIDSQISLYSKMLFALFIYIYYIKISTILKMTREFFFHFPFIHPYMPYTHTSWKNLNHFNFSYFCF